jgi:hypothetical protein
MERHPPPSGWPGPRPRPGVRRRASARPAPRPSWTRWLLDARVTAAVLGTLAALGLMGATLSFTVDLFVAPWRILSSDAEESLHLAASLVGLAGAFQLSRGATRGRLVVLAGLALNVAATLALSRRLLDRPEVIVPLLTWVALAAWTIACRRDSGPEDWPPPPPPGVGRYPWPPPPL